MNNGYIPFEGVIEGEGPGGVGMEINQDRAGHFIVQRLEPHGPAESSKISIGDRILRINDGLHIIEVVELMRGDVGTKVRLQIQSATRKRTVALKGRKMAPSNQLRPLLNKELPGTSHK
jgi:C-terminal processing protease CtpA/Prc